MKDLEILVIIVIAIILIRMCGVFEEFSGFGNVIDGMREQGREIGTQGTCQPVELGRNSVNWTPGGSQARLRAVAFDARITAGSNFNQITSVTRCFRYARTTTDRSSSLPRELCNDDGEIERGFLIKNLLPTCSLNDGSFVVVIWPIDRYVSIIINLNSSKIHILHLHPNYKISVM